MKKISLYIFIVVLLFSCQKEKKKQAEDDILTATSISNGVNVSTITIQNQPFQIQLIANGIVEAVQKSELRFKTNEQLVRLNVSNGDLVTKGQEIASLENSLLANNLEKATIDVAKAKNKFIEEKINYGLANVSEKDMKPAVLKSLKIKSGYFEAENALANAQLLYKQTILKAPFDGVIANVKVKEGFYVSASEVFCTIINPTKLEVVFSILESEYSFVKKGQKITLQSFSNVEKTFKGIISQINPLVDENGLIEIKASINTKDLSLFDGMHVKVLINKPIKDVIVVPKEALVLRSNRKVVFTLENGLAKWNYVTELYENSTHYAIKKGENLKKTDTIIVSGNMNLSHDAKVNAAFINKKQNK
ncbi:Multidrug resistance protein MdtA [Polaribacter huanghezhanensis]|uniref:efflux RND transporter periplasmic adaptor subunit n=1 Tax=Polaribacter huanghezhanensis TaxID=1354726 RepID=UPI002649BA1F|nr:efflux RND transporter periplasmic adaptor subunit [Polaribacter huanghezhanensis]WKD85054.1 Multidrug resistance protein MdtA [Polaribacter huanghezhanensis]